MINKKDFINIFILAVLTIFFFREILIEPTELLAAGDLISESVFGTEFIHRTFQEFGERALWNPYTSLGLPHIAQIELGQYSLTSLIFLFGYKDFFVNFVIIFHVFLAGLFMYILLRSLSLRRSSATIGSIIFMFGRNFLDNAYGNITGVISYAYIPLMFWSFEKFLQKRNLKWATALGFFVGIHFLAGRIQLFYLSSISLSLYALIRIYVSRKEFTKLDIIHFSGYLILAAIIFFGVTAIQLLPMLEISPLTIQNNNPDVKSYEFSVQESVPFKQFVTLLIPDLFGKRTDNSYWGIPSRILEIYIGILPLILTIIAIVYVKNCYKAAFIALAVFSVLFSLGKYTPFYGLLYKFLPGVSLFKVPGRMLMMFTLSMAALAAFGAEHVISQRINSKIPQRLLLISILSSLSTLFALLILKPKILDYGKKLLEEYFYSRYSGTYLVKSFDFEYFSSKIPLVFNHILLGITKLAILLLLIFLLFKLLSRIPVKARGGIMISILVFDILLITNIYDWSELKKTNAPDGFPESGRYSEYIKQWDNLIKEIKNDNSLFRVNGIPPLASIKNSLYILGHTNSMPIYYSEKYFTYVNSFNHSSSSKMLGLANIKYILTMEKLPEEKFVLLKENLTYSDGRFGINKRFSLYQNKDWMPRAFIVPNSRTADLESQFEILTNWTFDPKEEVLITESIDLDGGQEFKEANITYYSPNKVTLHAQNNKPGFLVMGDTYYPGWKAYDNGKETKIYHANYIMRALYLPAGEHDVEFIYDPISYKIGKYITAITLLIVLLISIGLFLSRRN